MAGRGPAGPGLLPVFAPSPPVGVGKSPTDPRLKEWGRTLGRNPGWKRSGEEPEAGTQAGGGVGKSPRADPRLEEEWGRALGRTPGWRRSGEEP